KLEVVRGAGNDIRFGSQNRSKAVVFYGLAVRVIDVPMFVRGGVYIVYRHGKRGTGNERDVFITHETRTANKKTEAIVVNGTRKLGILFGGEHVFERNSVGI